MDVDLPLTLSGDTLGQRHRHLNSLVRAAHQQDTSFSLQRRSEHSILDRLFNIDLASKHRDVDFIILNLKDEDMLYVSRALKSSWLLETQYRHIINPVHLEENMYPEMITTAVNKMKHWIHQNLRDTQRCEEFFEYYNNNNFDLAIKFLWYCSNECILGKVPDILDKLSPKYLKLLSEKCPEVAKIYFDSLEHNESALSKYLPNDKKYYNSIKFLLKVNADIFLDITEKYFFMNCFRKFSAEATKYIMSNCKNRFTNKPELYTASLLDINTLAKFLSGEEIKDVILRLARAEYLNFWFSYKNVEPMIKKLDVETRTAFKKQVFVDKSFGDLVKEWPYKPPAPPQRKETEVHIFEDREHSPYEYENCMPEMRSMCIMKRSGRGFLQMGYCMQDACRLVVKTYLDQLFEKYRFYSFEKTLHELRTKMTVENLKNRQDMMLVLVSKSGGRSESVEQLLTLLMTRHENEPANLRAAIVRSLVKRCAAWRLPQEPWDLLMQFGRGLGLDGAPPVAPCNEGLHAVVLRNIVLNQELTIAVKNAFMKEFSSLNEYSLNASERRLVSAKLPALLLSEADANLPQALLRLTQLLDTLDAYKIQADKFPGVVQAIAATSRCNNNAQSLLSRLFNARIARKELFKENFAIIQTDASYFNALKHNTEVLKSGEEFEVMIKSGRLKHERFLRSLALYFGEKNGLADKYFSLLERNAETLHDKQIARPLAILAGTKLVSLLHTLDASPKTSAPKRFSAVLRANAHLPRPFIDLKTIDWQWLGSKAVANRVMTCSAVNTDSVIEKLLTLRRTEKIAMVLSMRIGKELPIFETVAAKKPQLTLKTALKHNKNGKLNSGIWDIILPLIVKLDTSKKINDRFIKMLNNVSIVPSNMKPDYCMKVFDVLTKISREKAMVILCNLENILCDVDDQFIESIVRDFLTKEMTKENLSKFSHFVTLNTSLHMRVIGKFILLSENESTQNRKLENVANVFFDRFEELWQETENRETLLRFLNEFILSLKYTKVFLDVKYVSCLPVFEHITHRLQKFLPIELHINIYVHLHLNMLYFKSIRQGIKNNPDVFDNLTNNIKQAVEIVGIIFGNYIGHEINELSTKYFESIINLYKEDLMNYLRDNFEYSHTKNNLFTASIIKGIVESEHNKVHLLAAHIYNGCRRSMDQKVADDVFEVLKQSKCPEIPFFLNVNYQNFY